MRLRIARKMDPGDWQRRARGLVDERVYTDAQLERADRRLRKSWQTRCPPRNSECLGRPCVVRSVNRDFFAANRVHARRLQQRALRRVRNGGR